MTGIIFVRMSLFVRVAFHATFALAQETSPAPTPTPFCTSICPTGTLPDPSRDDEILFTQDGVNITCKLYQSFAADGRFSELECSSASYLGVNKCGCTSTGSFCQICEDGSVAPNLTFEASPPYNCLDLAGFAYDVSPGSESCLASRSVDGLYCGCQNPIASEGACRLCNDTLPQPEREIEFRGSMEACSFVEYSANVNPPEQCATFQSLGTECCVVTPSPTPLPPTMSPTPRPSDNPVCHVCIEAGVEPGIPGEIVELPGIGTFNCSSLVQFGLDGFVREDNCRNFQLVAMPCKCGEDPIPPTSSPTDSPGPTVIPTQDPTASPSVKPSASPQTASPSATPSESSSGFSIYNKLNYLHLTLGALAVIFVVFE